jgi:hypothetical protein
MSNSLPSPRTEPFCQARGTVEDTLRAIESPRYQIGQALREIERQGDIQAPVLDLLWKVVELATGAACSDLAAQIGPKLQSASEDNEFLIGKVAELEIRLAEAEKQNALLRSWVAEIEAQQNRKWKSC